MDERLSVSDVARIKFARDLALVDALNLMRQRNRLAAVGVNAGDPQDHYRNTAMLLVNEFLRLDF